MSSRDALEIGLVGDHQRGAADLACHKRYKNHYDAVSSGYYARVLRAQSYALTPAIPEPQRRVCGAAVTVDRFPYRPQVQ